MSEPQARPDREPGTIAEGSRSVALAGANSGAISTGDNSSINITTVGPLPPVTQVPPHPGPVGLPGRVPLFVGRQSELALLGRALAAEPGPTVVQAVHGLGGIGKTALAARYALEHVTKYTQVVWITAEDRAAVEGGLARFTLALEPYLGTVLPTEALAARAVAWLSAHGGWLLVLDNVSSVGDIDALLAAVGTGSGRVLATSRTAVGWNRIGATAVRLDVLKPNQALALLAAAVGTSADTLDHGAELCGFLGYLPLAIVQAGAYITQNQSTDRPDARGYLSLLNRFPAELYARADVETDPERTLARVWRVTLDRLADTPLAGEVLRILAWYGSDAIPLDLLDGLAPEPDLGEAVGRLAAYNMLIRSPTGPPGTSVLAVHRLVQAVTRTPDADDPHRTADTVLRARGQAAALLNDAVPGNPVHPESWPAYRRLMPHIDAFCEHAPPGTDPQQLFRVLNNAGMFLDSQGSAARAIRHLERAYGGITRTLGEEHADSLAVLNNLAFAHQSAGELRQALPFFQQALAGRVRVLGGDHPDTLTTRSNLASAHQAAGDLRRAVPLHEQLLFDRIRVLGDDHADTVATRSNLAGAYQAAGEPDRAILLYEQALAAFRRVSGEEHPHTLTALNNLASAYQNTGELNRAIPLYERALDGFRHALGEDHPHTLTARNNLASAYRAVGDAQAVPLYEAILADSRRVLGEEHPATLTTRNNLAGAYRAAGDLDRAGELYERTLAVRLQILGADHRDTLATRNNLAYTLQLADRLDQAIAIYEAILPGFRRSLGEDHPDTLATQANLAAAYQAAGKLAEAVALYEWTLVEQARLLGESHPSTLITRNNLAHAYRAAGETDKAVTLFDKTLEDCRRALGQAHPTTRAAQAGLASALGQER